MLKKSKKFLKVAAFALAGMVALTACSGENSKKEETEENKETTAQVEVKQQKTEGFEELSTEKLKENYEDSNWVLVDTRLNDSYNGWKLYGESRGGHIKGAVDFSANWLTVENDNKESILEEALEIKGIDKEKNIVLYDANGEESKVVAEYLKAKGYESLYVYDVDGWADDTSLPMEKYENYETIVPAKVVKNILDGKDVETFEPGTKVKMVEASWGGEELSYAKEGVGHIPTSFHINTDIIEPPTENPPMWMLASDEKLEQFAKDYGFTKDDTVIVTSEGQIAAYRVASVLKYMGVKDVRVLNGGLASWKSAGYEVEMESNKPVPVESFGAKIPLNEGVIDTLEETIEGLKNPEEFTLVDNRTWKEHIGEDTGYSYHDKAGRVPGSVFGYAGKTDSYSLDYYRNIDGTMRNKDEILALWAKSNIDTTKHLSFMCGSGWRVAEIYFYADTMGIPDIGIFSDGWIGWSNTEGLPTETGEPK